jgi:Asp-tRNA(Asn)/Glu-tRNA(Gln) amidotransferase A subunit family amidase
VTADEIADGENARRELRAAYLNAFDQVSADAVLTPTLGFEALRHGQRQPDRIGDGDPWSFVYDASMTGLPAITIPMGLGASGLPLGLHLTGPPFTDPALIGIAEHATDLLWHPTNPPHQQP